MNDQEALIKEAKDPNIVGLNPKQAVAHLLCLLQDCADAMAKAQPVPNVQESSTSYSMTLTCTRCGAVDKGTLTVPNVQRQWVGLTDEEIEDVWASCEPDWDDKVNVLTLARAIEAAHGITGETK
jgi:hypothetical protein